MFPSPFARLFGMVSAPFDNEQYRNQGDKATKKRNRYQKVIICLAVISAPNLCLLRRNFCAAGDVLFGYSGAIFERSRSPFHCLQRRKICTICAENRRCTKSLFRVVENGKFLKRLRNGHLEKSAATGIFRV